MTEWGASAQVCDSKETDSRVCWKGGEKVRQKAPSVFFGCRVFRELPGVSGSKQESSGLATIQIPSCYCYKTKVNLRFSLTVAR
jgi:hypothetical protein